MREPIAWVLVADQRFQGATWWQGVYSEMALEMYRAIYGARMLVARPKRVTTEAIWPGMAR